MNRAFKRGIKRYNRIFTTKLIKLLTVTALGVRDDNEHLLFTNKNKWTCYVKATITSEVKLKRILYDSPATQEKYTFRQVEVSRYLKERGK